VVLEYWALQRFGALNNVRANSQRILQIAAKI
jgi:hypothetical protein